MEKLFSNILMIGQILVPPIYIMSIFFYKLHVKVPGKISTPKQRPVELSPGFIFSNWKILLFPRFVFLRTVAVHFSDFNKG